MEGASELDEATSSARSDPLLERGARVALSHDDTARLRARLADADHRVHQQVEALLLHQPAHGQHEVLLAR